ncbi:hypothetical protein [Pseudomonas cavernicola]|uniref:hypothetical protein n=1 Tax=Pseudomonas cavernicola TaxID=2320866 RepID=UPI003B75B9CA
MSLRLSLAAQRHDNYRHTETIEYPVKRLQGGIAFILLKLSESAQRDFAHKRKLILAKPRDRHDTEDIPAIERACMSFAATRGLRSHYQATLPGDEARLVSAAIDAQRLRG